MTCQLHAAWERTLVRDSAVAGQGVGSAQFQVSNGPDPRVWRLERKLEPTHVGCYSQRGAGAVRAARAIIRHAGPRPDGDLATGHRMASGAWRSNSNRFKPVSTDLNRFKPAF